MRVSDIHRWVECEAYALAAPPTESVQHVATVVGTLAHAGLADVLRRDPPPTQGLPIRYDAVTRNWAQVLAQARDIEAEARRVLAAEDWHIIEQEELVTEEGVTGYLDLRCWSREHGEAVIDLKTGALPGQGWLQVGGYITLSERISVTSWGGVLHVPRVAVGRETTGGLTLRPAPALVEAWKQAKARIDLVLAGAVALRRPGLHCGRCPLHGCAVRSG